MKIENAPVVHLLHGAHYATLATHSSQLPGYPYATAVPNVLDEQHRPVLLVSALAEHTRNLLQDPRASLALAASSVTRIQNEERLTLVADAERFEPVPELIQRYTRYEPDAALYLTLDFMFFRLNPVRLRYIAGVGRMGWLDAGTLQDLPVVSLADETRLVALAQQHAPPELQVLGLDCFGLDYRMRGERRRCAWASGNTLEEQVLATVPQIGQAQTDT